MKIKKILILVLFITPMFIACDKEREENKITESSNEKGDQSMEAARQDIEENYDGGDEAPMIDLGDMDSTNWDWVEFSNKWETLEADNYLIDYPFNWEVEENNLNVRFSPGKDRYFWGVMVFDQGQLSVQDVISSIESDFSSDLQMIKENIQINGISAVKTSVDGEGLEHRAVVFSSNNKVYYITNGGLNINFEKFYESFRLKR